MDDHILVLDVHHFLRVITQSIAQYKIVSSDLFKCTFVVRTTQLYDLHWEEKIFFTYVIRPIMH